jgi:hypothetical protein
MAGEAVIFAKAGQFIIEGCDTPFNTIEEAWAFAGVDPDEPTVEEAEEADEKILSFRRR